MTASSAMPATPSTTGTSRWRTRAPARNSTPSPVASSTVAAPKSGSSSSSTAARAEHGDGLQEALEVRCAARRRGARRSSRCTSAASRARASRDLEIHEAEPHPAPRAIHLVTDAGDQHEHAASGTRRRAGRSNTSPRRASARRCPISAATRPSQHVHELALEVMRTRGRFPFPRCRSTPTPP